MANALLGNVIHCDTGSSFAYEQRNGRLVGILFTPAASGDSLVLTDSATGGDKVTIKATTANDTKHIDLSSSPIVFSNGIYVKTLTSGAKAVLIISQAGT